MSTGTGTHQIIIPVLGLTKVTQNITNGANFVLPKGELLVKPGATSKIQFHDGSGWVDLNANGVGAGFIQSDGLSYRILAGATEDSFYVILA